MTTNVYIVTQATGQWTVFHAGRHKGGYASQFAAMQQALTSARLARQSGGKSSVLLEEPDGRMQSVRL